MGRLQRYLRRLSFAEWESLYAEAQKRFRGKTLALLERLRGTGVPQQLTPSEKELAQRLERWIWQRAYILHQHAHKLTEAPPIEWIFMGAQLYREKELIREALEVLNLNRSHPLEALRLLFQKIAWEVSEGRLHHAMIALRKSRQGLMQLDLHLRQLRLQIWLHGLLREYGGSYSIEGRRALNRLEQYIDSMLKLSKKPEGGVLALSLQVTYLIAQGQVEAALRLTDECAFPSPAEVLLNRWLCQLMLRRPLKEIHDSTVAAIVGPLPPLSRAILLNRVLLNLLQAASPAVLRQYRPQLERWILRTPLYRWENAFTWAQVLWLMGDSAASATILAEIPPSVGRFLWLQTQLLRLLLHIEGRNWIEVIRSVRSLSHLLRQLKSKIASAPLLHKLVRRLYKARLSPGALPKAVALWEAHLQAMPSEKAFWALTLLSDWIKAQLQRKSLTDYRAMQCQDSLIIEQMLYKVDKLLM